MATAKTEQNGTQLGLKEKDREETAFTQYWFEIASKWTRNTYQDNGATLVMAALVKPKLLDDISARILKSVRSWN